MQWHRFVFVCLLMFLAMSFLQIFLILDVDATASFTKLSQSSLWYTTTASVGLAPHFWSYTTNQDHDIIVQFPFNYWYVYSLGSQYSSRIDLHTGSKDFLQRKHGGLGTWAKRLIAGQNDNATITFSGFRVLNDGLYREGDQNYLFVTPYNTTGCIADFELSSINLGAPTPNFTALIRTAFQFGGLHDNSYYNASKSPIEKGWVTGNTTASWNTTMQAIVASSTSQNGYTALASRLRSDTTGSWTFSYSIWNSSSDFNSWISDKWVLDNSSTGALPTTSTNVFGALAYNNTSGSGTYKLHFTVYMTFANDISTLNKRLNELVALDPQQSYVDSNRYWYDLYTTYSAVNFNNDNLNKLYYWAKHMVNVAHFGKRLFASGHCYDQGFRNFYQDNAYACYSSMVSGLWENVKRYFDYSLLYSIDAVGQNHDGFASGSPYYTKNMIGWTNLPYSSSPTGKGSVRATLDFLDSVVRYTAYTNTTFAQNNWVNLTNLIETVHNVTTAEGIFPLTQKEEDTDSSLGCNVIYYHVLKEFSAISNKIGISSYAATLENRASTLKTQLNKEVGSGGLWSSTAGYFVSNSSVSPSDTNPRFYLWLNSLAINYDVANSPAKKMSILGAIENKLEYKWGFEDRQGRNAVWYMKMHELARAYSTMEDSSRISKIVWAHINNPHSGLTEAGSSTRFNFPEYWTADGTGDMGGALQYAWSSSPATMTIEVLLGIQPSVNNIKIQSIKPNNVSTITVINMRVRSALWNVSVTGSGSYVNSVKIDGSSINSQVIPTSYYSGNHTIEVTLGNKPTTPIMKETTAQLTSITYIPNKLTISLDSSSGTTSITQVYCGDKSKPPDYGVTIGGQQRHEGDGWSYDIETKILTVTATHSSSVTVEIDWTKKGGSVPSEWLTANIHWIAIAIVLGIIFAYLLKLKREEDTRKPLKH